MDLRCCFSFQDTSHTQRTYPPISRVAKGVVAASPLSSSTYSSKEYMPGDYLFQRKLVVPRRRFFWFTFFIFDISANGPSFESLILPIQHSTCHETADSHSTPSRQKAEASSRLVQERISFLIECGYQGHDDIETGVNNGIDYQEAKDVEVNKKTEGVILGSWWSLNYVCPVAVAAYERYDWTVKHRRYYAAIIDNCPQCLRKESGRNHVQ